MADERISIRIPERLADRIDRTGRSIPYVLRRAVEYAKLHGGIDAVVSHESPLLEKGPSVPRKIPADEIGTMRKSHVVKYMAFFLDTGVPEPEASQKCQFADEVYDEEQYLGTLQAGLIALQTSAKARLASLKSRTAKH